MSRGMKRLAWFVAAAALSVAAVLLLIVVLLPRDTLKTRIGEQIAGWTGRDVSLRGDPKIGLFPLRVTLDDVEVGGPAGMDDAEILSMDRLTGKISLIPLIIGRVEVDSFTMVRPLIRLVRDRAGRRNWEFDSGAAALQLAFAGDVPLGSFRVEGGTVLYEDRQTGASERLDSVNLAVEWASVRNPIAINGAGIWRGEEVKFSAGATAPFAYLNGAETPVEARIDTAPLGMTLSGKASDYPDMKLSGALKLNTPSLRRFAAWLGSALGPGSTLGQASLVGTASLADNVLSVADATFTLDGNQATGALEITAGAAPDVAGTLAFNALDLTPYFAGLSAALALGPDWRRVPLPTDWFGEMSADIRLSADSVKLGGFNAGSTAASVSLRDRRLEIGLARAALDAGGISGDLTLTDLPTAPGADVAAQLRATDVNVADTAPFLGLPKTLAGTATAVVDVTAHGGDLGSLVESLGGTAELHVADGTVPLFGVAEMAAAASDASAPAPGAASGPTPVQSAVVGLSFLDGVGTIERASVVTPSYSVSAEGRIGLLDGGLSLNGTLNPGTPEAATGPEAPFTIEGTLANPVAKRQALAN
jgi:AsmA protein